MKAFTLIAALILTALPTGFSRADGIAGSEIRAIRPSAGDAKLAWAFKAHISEIAVKCTGTVIRKLEDDVFGGRHQRFIIRLDSGQTLLIAHNIDLAPRVRNLRLKDRVRVSGEYIWNSQGGLIHETHNDPAGIELGGFIKHRGIVYR